jgi:rare lipoprotein A
MKSMRVLHVICVAAECLALESRAQAQSIYEHYLQPGTPVQPAEPEGAARQAPLAPALRPPANDAPPAAAAKPRPKSDWPRASRAARTGMASYYHDWFQGKTTANGDVYDRNAMTAAHPSLPLGTRVRVTNLRNKRSVELLINDRLPAHHGRLVDVSRMAAGKLGMLKSGLAKVKLEIIEPAASVDEARN